MAKKKHIETELEREYKKARRRLQQIIRRAKKRGYIFPTKVIPEVVKRVTKKSVERLEKITPSSIYKKATTIPENPIKPVKPPIISRPRQSKQEPKLHKSRLRQDTPYIPKERKKKTETQEAYDKQRERIKQFIKRAEKRGYTFTGDVIPPKITDATIADVEGLQALTADVLYTKATYTDPTTGRTISGTKRRDIERSEAGKKAYKTRIEREEAEKYQAYRREKERVMEIIETLKREAADRGYLLPKDFLRELGEKVDNDKIDTEGLKKITEEAILGSGLSRFKDPRTGTIHSGEEGLKLEKHRREIEEKYQLDYDTGVTEETRVLEVVQDMIDTWEPSITWTEYFTKIKTGDHRTLKNVLQGAIDAEGRAVIAQRLQDNATRAIELAESILWESGDDEEGRNTIHIAINEFVAILYGRNLTADESMELTDTIEMNELFS